MNKLSKIFLVIIIILALALGVMVYYFFYWKDAYFRAANQMVEVVQRLETIESKYDRSMENVTLTIKKDSITPSGATIIITDKNENQYTWGENYSLQIKENNAWKDVTPKTDMIFNEIAYVLDKNGQFEQTLDWSTYYGKLASGTYKIIKHITTPLQDIYFDTDEFVIE